MSHEELREALEKPERQIPKTLEDAVRQLWYANVGTNGDGMYSRMKKIEDRVEHHLDWHVKSHASGIITGVSLVVAALALLLRVMDVV